MLACLQERYAHSYNVVHDVAQNAVRSVEHNVVLDNMLALC